MKGLSAPQRLREIKPQKNATDEPTNKWENMELWVN
jgi:hypothetical protein